MVSQAPFETINPPLCQSTHVHKEAIPYLRWHQIIDEELSALHKICTWDLVHLSPSKSFVGYCWVYKLKTRCDDSIEQFKAWLVSK